MEWVYKIGFMIGILALLSVFLPSSWSINIDVSETACVYKIKHNEEDVYIATCMDE